MADAHFDHDHTEVPAATFVTGDLVQPSYFGADLWEVLEINGTEDMDNVRCRRLRDGREMDVHRYRIEHGACLRCIA